MTWNVMRNVWVPIFNLGQGHSVSPNPQNITSCSSEPFAAKLVMIVHYHEPGCCMPILDCMLCSRSRSQWEFKSSGEYIICPDISSKSLNLSLSNVGCWCIFMTWSVMGKVRVKFLSSRSRSQFGSKSAMVNKGTGLPSVHRERLPKGHQATEKQLSAQSPFNHFCWSLKVSWGWFVQASKCCLPQRGVFLRNSATVWNSLFARLGFVTKENIHW